MTTHIRINDISPRIQYVGDGVQTQFTFPFPVFNNGDLAVYLGGATQALSVDYTVSGAGADTGGAVTFTIAPGNGALVTLRRNLSIHRTSDFQQSGEFRAKVINDELDYQTAVLQELSEIQSRTPQRAMTSSSTADLTLPDPAAGATLMWNATANGIANGPAAGQISAAQANATAAAGSAASAATSETNAAASAATALAATVGKYDRHVHIAFADSPYTIAAPTVDTLITVDTTAGDVTVNLPASAGEADNRLLGINKSSAVNTVTITPNGTDTVGGLASFVMFDATEWCDLYLDKSAADWQMGNLSYTAAGAGLSKTGSTLSVATGGVGVAMLAAPARPYDIGFTAGFDSTMAPDVLAVRVYGEIVAARAMSLIGEVAAIALAPTGAAAVFDVLLNGVSVYTTKPQFAAATTLTPGVLATTAVAAGDRLTFACTQTGNAEPGRGVTFTMQGELA
ncbi:hypothetical protein [Varunaivibrio sulfuroxidans]|uniref:Uncharacterized protein n=1 Tax=Varunaivibrio sulfuroxidans TaxID=1773489 RepID=A0A4R3J9K4_9PROT|nr:hypothetical protein [Varunaivibrio sulfuroxidans]TCS61686.1 hypothetical protein EDD55_10795 [Varunaivibrio sulfuroxidans]WES32131.1 hypothetical protein P3M64_07170 [Varunaivibrio sulfuroxidans]